MPFGFRLDTFFLPLGLIFAGFAQGLSGFAIGLLAVGVLVAVYPPSIVIPSLVLVYFLCAAILLYEHRGVINRELLRSNPIFSSASLVMAVAGLPVGSYFLRRADREATVLTLGIVICSIAIYYFFSEIRGRLAVLSEYNSTNSFKKKLICYFCCSFAGVLEGFLGTGGPAIAFFLLFFRYNRALFIASFQLFFFVLLPFRFLLYLSLGLYSFETLKLAGISSSFIIVGLFIGIYVRKRFVNDYVFRKIVIILLFFIGLNLVTKYYL